MTLSARLDALTTLALRAVARGDMAEIERLDRRWPSKFAEQRRRARKRSKASRALSRQRRKP